jgi:hypothetical protein
LAEWKQLNDSNWKPASTKAINKETIIPVRPEAHCELLEIQAGKFRKIENNQMLALQRLLNMEIKHAVETIEFKKILAKHNEIGYLLTHSYTHSLTYSLTHLLTYSLTYSLTHSLTYSLTHSLTHSL